MVMDYVEGTTLRDRLRDRPLAASEIVPIMKQVAAGIQHAHEHNIVHCDLKPENVLLDSKGRAVVTDFGFAHIIAGTTSASSIGGTAGFIAPEVMSGRSLPTPAADIYGMGMLMRTLLTNQPINEEAFDAIIQRCIAEDPSARYGSASEFAKDLESLCQAATV